MLSKILVALALVSPGIALAEARSYTAVGTAEFMATGSPGFIRIAGKGGRVQGTAQQDAEGKVAGTFKVKLVDFDTGNKTRNEHMRAKYLDVAKFPEATLELAPVKPAASGFKWDGRLTIKGETKPVSGTATLAGDKLSAQFTLNINDFPAIGVPSHLGITVAKEVDVKVEATVQ